MSHGSPLNAGNADFLTRLYDTYLEAPENVSRDWRAFFESLSRITSENHRTARDQRSSESLSTLAEKQTAVLQLINAYRFRGHRQANLDPLNLYERPMVPDLVPRFHGLLEADLDKIFNSGSLVGPPEAPLRDILATVRDTYCGSIGAEYMYLTSTEQKRWIQARLEGAHGRHELTRAKKRDLLKRLTAATKLEEYLHKKYVGQKRFSLEGAESLIPLLDELILYSGSRRVKEIIIGMAHRGRLNVLVNIFGKHPKVLSGEFEGKIRADKGSGDVKYHLGFSSDINTSSGPIHIVLAFNPSHLEIIDPVVEGSVRARQERRNDHERGHVLPVLIHGDAAFAGQGVVMETLNLSETRGYGTGGTIHIVLNNQIGFTTSDPLDSRSTLYCTDVAKMVQAPIFHVNGDDPEAVVFLTQLALDFRLTFNKDVVIDMVCYRRHGHNEADNPLVTQPMMYKKVLAKQDVRQLYAERLTLKGVLRKQEADQIVTDYLAALEANQVVSRPMIQPRDQRKHYFVDWSPYVGADWRAPVPTAISAAMVEQLGMKLCDYPEHFELHRAVVKIIEARREMARGLRPVDWGFAELLAYASLLQEGFSVRLSGQDSERGTFFHRHAVLHNQRAPEVHRPLEHLFVGQPRFRVINSLLSEEAVLAFEYGYSTAEPQCLVIWEAQFGDFANGAQVVIDQFLSSSEAKWGRYSGLVLMLPHGYEGQGPEHSSARLERYLQLCAEDNLQVCVPTTPAQLFHLLRRQMLRPYRKPLVLLTPKSLLRHRLSIATREELVAGGFCPVMDEVDPLDPAQVSRLVLCSGKVYYDLLEKRREHQLEHIALLRLEQLYPYPQAELKGVLARYPKAKEVLWVQEEPRNQGAWYFLDADGRLAGSLPPGVTVHYAGRPAAPAPAAGYLHVHLEEQAALLNQALGSATEHIPKSRAERQSIT
jgi:2-oxoglutarate dehydrogenase E1 component